MDKLDFKTIGGYTAGLLIFMSAMRLLLQTQEFGIPIMDFVSFSNMIEYVLDVLYGTWPFIFISCLVILFRFQIDTFIINQRTRNSWLFRASTLWWIIGPLVVIVVYIYEFVSFGYSTSLFLKSAIFIGIGLVGIWVRYFRRVTENNILLASMIFAFVFLSTKVVICYENNLYTSRQPVYTMIKFKDPGKNPPFISDSINRFVTSTMDFAFTYNSSAKRYTAYPMSGIFSIENKGK
jgi:hypothetical protein